MNFFMYFIWLFVLYLLLVKTVVLRIKLNKELFAASLISFGLSAMSARPYTQILVFLGTYMTVSIITFILSLVCERR